ncbi:MAG: hypothetical protein K2P93_07025 [Alphaproteobacteria bacterium]|nr:hypothetical protein [Alphaproteobacteria bacterium]
MSNILVLATIIFMGFNLILNAQDCGSGPQTCRGTGYDASKCCCDWYGPGPGVTQVKVNSPPNVPKLRDPKCSQVFSVDSNHKWTGPYPYINNPQPGQIWTVAFNPAICQGSIIVVEAAPSCFNRDYQVGLSLSAQQNEEIKLSPCAYDPTNCCYGQPFNPDAQGCCQNKIYPISRCCNGVFINESQGCCNGVSFDKATQGCCNKKIYDLTTQACCGNSVIDGVTSMTLVSESTGCQDFVLTCIYVTYTTNGKQSKKYYSSMAGDDDNGTIRFFPSICPGLMLTVGQDCGHHSWGSAPSAINGSIGLHCDFFNK